MNDFKVLLVDDEVDFTETLVKRLSKRNLKVSAVASGRAALSALDDFDVDVMVLDIRMPDMDGIQVLREAKQKRPLLEVILLTGHANMEVAVEGMELGAFDYLIKPVDLDELLYKLQDAHKKKVLQEEKIKRLQEKM